jgi:DNA-binding Lrp family transcriptional regulator
MPSARASSRGAFLNWRLAVNGIQQVCCLPAVQSRQAGAQCACALAPGSPAPAQYDAARSPRDATNMRSSTAPVQLDAIDRAILTELQATGRLSNLELAQRVHLSPSACLRRVKALEDSGVIAQYVALLNPKAVGRHGTELHHHQPRQHAAAAAAGLRTGGARFARDPGLLLRGRRPTTTWCALPTATPKTWSASTPRCCRGCRAWCAATRCWCCAR